MIKALGIPSFPRFPRIPAWRKQRINHQHRVKDSIVDMSITHMDQIFHAAVTQVVANYMQTGHYHAPSLLGLYQVGERFYRNTIKHAYIEAEKDLDTLKDKKQLALGPTPNVKSSLNTLEKFFRDKRAWPTVVRRNQKFIDQLRKVYLRKLQYKFNKIIPKLRRGETTIEEVKTELQETWQATRARVNLIFRTESTTYFNAAQVNFFEGTDAVIGFLFDAVRDNSVTDICRTRHGLIYTPGSEILKKEKPASHYNCRSSLIALTDIPYNRKLIENKELGRETTSRYIAPLLPGWR